jgi:uncharacterized protein YjgD (DUF1641 family)
MVEIRSSLSNEELDELERTQTSNTLSLNLVYLSIKSLDEEYEGKITQVIELPDFEDTRREAGLSDADIQKAIKEILDNPLASDVIPGCNGVRKLRVAISCNNKGKSAGARVGYLNYFIDEKAYLLDIIINSKQSDFTQKQIKQMAKAAELIKKGGK